MDDLISRQDAIDVAKQHWYKPDIAKALEKLPSAQPKDVIHITGRRKFVSKFDFDEDEPERKKGEWRWNDEMKCFLCSECEQGWREQPTLNGKPLFEWCPVCGADMREE